MNEAELARALIDAGLGKIIALCFSGPIGVVLTTYIIHYFVSSKRVKQYKSERENEREERKKDKEELKCRLNNPDQNWLKDFMCQFTQERQNHLNEIKNQTSQFHLIMDKFFLENREDRKLMIELLEKIFQKGKR